MTTGVFRFAFWIVFALGALMVGTDAKAQATTPADDYRGYQRRTGSNPFGKRAADSLSNQLAYLRQHSVATRYSNRDIRYRGSRDLTMEGNDRDGFDGTGYGRYGRSGSRLHVEYVPTCFYRTKDKTVAYNFKPVFRRLNRYSDPSLRIDDVGPIPKYRLSQPAISVSTISANQRLVVKQRNITASRQVEYRERD